MSEYSSLYCNPTVRGRTYHARSNRKQISTSNLKPVNQSETYYLHFRRRMSKCESICSCPINGATKRTFTIRIRVCEVGKQLRTLSNSESCDNNAILHFPLDCLLKGTEPKTILATIGHQYKFHDRSLEWGKLWSRELTQTHFLPPSQATWRGFGLASIS